MRRSDRFERRLLVALVLFSLIPTLLLVGLGTLVLRDAVSLQATPAGWERLGETGRTLLEHAEASGDSTLIAAASDHRRELTTSIQNAQRWSYLNRRVLETLPWLAGGLVLVLTGLGVRSARGMARQLSGPIRELVGWSRRIGRGEPLPAEDPNDPEEAGEFGVLRRSFRGMARELEVSRARALEAERVRASVALARGVAHELKNALTPLRFAVRTVRTRAAPDPRIAESLDVIEAESERLEGLARAFAQFGRPPEGTPSRIDLAELLEYLSRTHHTERIVFDLDLPGDLPQVEGYHDALARAFANLVLNAMEAIGEDAGEIRISAAVPRDGAVEIRVADSGPGIPPEAAARIWDPDFTTKTRGTGLGLSLVRQTIRDHGGSISASSPGGGGAEFRIILPAAPALDEDSSRPVLVEERV